MHRKSFLTLRGCCGEMHLQREHKVSQVRSLFSASLSEAVEELARSMMHSPLRITVGERGAANASVAQSLQFVGRCDC